MLQGQRKTSTQRHKDAKKVSCFRRHNSPAADRRAALIINPLRPGVLALSVALNYMEQNH